MCIYNKKIKIYKHKTLNLQYYKQLKYKHQYTFIFVLLNNNKTSQDIFQFLSMI